MLTILTTTIYGVGTPPGASLYDMEPMRPPTRQPLPPSHHRPPPPLASGVAAVTDTIAAMNAAAGDDDATAADAGSTTYGRDGKTGTAVGGTIDVLV